MDQEDKVENVLNLIANLYPEDAEKISTIAFVNWHNLLNHAVLEKIDSKQLLFVGNLILALASAHFDNTSQGTLDVSDTLKQVSFDDVLKFLDQGAPPQEDKDI